jgi:hypothetical protein
MAANRFELFLSANRDLRAFLARVDGLASGRDDLKPDDLRALGRLLESMAPEIAQASPEDAADTNLQIQVKEYISHLRTLQSALEQVRCVMLARRAELDVARQHIEGFRGWADAYRQTA